MYPESSQRNAPNDAWYVEEEGATRLKEVSVNQGSNKVVSRRFEDEYLIKGIVWREYIFEVGFH